MNQQLSMGQVFLNRITEIIETNLANEKFGVEELSRELGMSRSNINRKLKSIYKNSISQLIREIRLQRAMDMLRQKIATASEIAFRVGFSSPAYFNKCFNEYFGFPPGEVKKLQEFDREKARHIIVPEPNADRTIARKKHGDNLKRLITRIGLPVLFLVLLVSSLSYFFNKPPFKRSTTAHDITIKDSDISIAVLPFKNLSNDPEQEFFSDGMMEEILSHLFMIGGLKIASSTTTMRFKGSKLSVREIALELGVSYVLEGSVSIAGDKVRIIVRLVNGKNEQLSWTQDYNRAMTAADLHDIQSDVAQQVAKNMNVVINPEVKKRIEARPTENIEAYTLFLRAKDFKLPLDQAEKLLEKVILLDPGFADAYGQLANYYLWGMRRRDGIKRQQILDIVEPLVNKALQLDKYSTYAHFTFMELRLYFYWDFESVEKEFQIFNQLIPSNSDIYYLFSDYLIASGRSREAYLINKKGFREDDFSKSKWMYMIGAYAAYGQLDKALETTEKALQVFPIDNEFLKIALGLFVGSGKYKEAIELFEKNVIYISPKDMYSDNLGIMAIAYFKTGNKRKYEAFLNELISRSIKSPLNDGGYNAASVYIAMGEKDKALQSLEKGYTNHEPAMIFLKVEPLFRPLHGDPRFENLLVKIGFK